VASSCVHHPARPAHALCMSCHRAVCQECATTWDGINYCAACLARRRQAAGPRSSFLGLLVVLGAAAGLFWIVARLMVWASVLAVELL
jgi:hypothetical protein